jgi:hypothetical protein
MKSSLVAQLYGVPHGILRIFNTILYKNKFQNAQIFCRTQGLFPEQTTLVVHTLRVAEHEILKLDLPAKRH